MVAAAARYSGEVPVAPAAENEMRTVGPTGRNAPVQAGNRTQQAYVSRGDLCEVRNAGSHLCPCASGPRRRYGFVVGVLICFGAPYGRPLRTSMHHKRKRPKARRAGDSGA